MSSNQQILLGEGAGSAPAVFVEDVFSTYLYTGNGATQTITNGIDLATKGGLVWLKSRSAAYGNRVQDTVRGAGSGKALRTNGTEGETASNSDLTAFTSSGFSLGYVVGDNNASGTTNVSWTFRKQPKFFDVVTWTGDGAASRNIAHTLGSQPGFIVCKQTDGSSGWPAAHRGNGTTGVYGFLLNSTSQGYAWADYNTYITSTTFDPTQLSGGFNTNAATYVAYLFAHDAGGFGLAGTDNVISCGTYTTTGDDSITLGYEPQFIIEKRTNDVGDWQIFDTMRGMSQTNLKELEANTAAVESSYAVGYVKPTATGYNSTFWSAGQTVIYIAIRRGPMKVPTVGTSVFAPVARTGTGTNPTVVTTGTNPDLLMSFPRTASPAAYGTVFFDKLRGVSQILQSANTNVEATTSGTFCLQGFLNTGFQTGADFIEGYLNYSGSTYANYAMTRAPGFFDEVCYTGTGVAKTEAHNLGAVPEWMIVKRRNAANNFAVYSAALGNTNRIFINQTGASAADSTLWNNTTPTNSVFTIGTAFATNNSGDTYVAYLFATCAGVSKVGSYTGTAAAQVINCGFTSGARFVLIKRTDSTGDWYVWDSARGIIAGDDPYLLLNSTAAEVTNTDYIDTDTTGFEISSTAPAAINASGGSFIFLAIA